MKKSRDAGMTLVETMAACVIMTILMTVLIQGVLAASNWFAESDRIKNSGEKAANRVEGSYDAQVSKTEERAEVKLDASVEGDPSMQLKEEENTKNTYTYEDVSLKTIESEVTDYVPEAEDPVYEPTRVDVSNIRTIYSEISKKISEEGYGPAGFAQEWQTRNNDAWLARILSEIGEWPAVSQQFKNKYNLDGGLDFGTALYIRAYFKAPSDGSAITENDILYYVTDTKAGGSNQWRPFLIYDPLSNVWLRCPKRSESSGLFNRYENYSFASGIWQSCASYSYYESDDNKYLHANSEDKVNSVSAQAGAEAILDFVRNPDNGWAVLYPDE